MPDTILGTGNTVENKKSTVLDYSTHDIKKLTISKYTNKDTMSVCIQQRKVFRRKRMTLICMCAYTCPGEK